MKALLSIPFVMALMCACSHVPEFSQTEEIGPYTVEMIQDGVWHVQDFNSEKPRGTTYDLNGNKVNNNCSDIYIVRGKKKALLIDLSNRIRWADGADEALRKIFYDRAGNREKIIALTHRHRDHSGMVPAFQDEPGIRFMLPRIDFETLGLTPEEKTSFFDEGYEFDLGGVKVMTVLVKGHTPGSMAYSIEGENIIFTGDAIGSGIGVWIFSLPDFRAYVEGVDHLIDFVEDPANKIDKEALTFYSGHSWQVGGLIRLDAQYLYDMCTLIKLIGEGKAYYEPYDNARMGLNANYKYGRATITWNSDSARQYREELNALQESE